MIEISLNNVRKSYGFKNILDKLSFEVHTGDRLSLIGENGCGKTTVLNIINGLEKVDSGNISIRKGSTIGYLNQQPENIYNDKIVKDVLYDSIKDILEVEYIMKKYEDKMAKEPSNISYINKYLNAQERYISMGGYEINTLVEKVSYGLNISDFINKKFNELSGGEQKRGLLASLIIKKPNI